MNAPRPWVMLAARAALRLRDVGLGGWADATDAAVRVGSAEEAQEAVEQGLDDLRAATQVVMATAPPGSFRLGVLEQIGRASQACAVAKDECEQAAREVERTG